MRLVGHSYAFLIRGAATNIHIHRIHLIVHLGEHLYVISVSCTMVSIRTRSLDLPLELWTVVIALLDTKDR